MRVIVVFSGAGLSAESGIPTFRDSNGLWENHKVSDVAHPDGWVSDVAHPDGWVSDVAHPDGWERDKELVLNFYKQRFESIKNSKPNAAHFAIASLQDKFDVVNLTQNIDDLLERAGCKNVRHFHGSINYRRCEWHKCGTMLSGDRRYTCDYIVENTEPIKLGDLCLKCGGQMRPDVVWFEEPVAFEFEVVRELVREVKYNNGVFICVGTSGQVHPASSLIPLFAQVNNKYIIDPNARRIANYTLLVGKAGEELPKLVEKLLSE